MSAEDFSGGIAAAVGYLQDLGFEIADKYSDTNRAWLLYLTKTPERPLEGYKDDLTTSYSWDNRVPNGSHLAIGDVIVLWDGTKSLGASVISQIKKRSGKKTVYRCQSCGKTLDNGPRKTKTPIYRCRNCEFESDELDSEVINVKTFKTEHSAAWVDLLGTIDIAELKSICHSPKSQHSIRPLKSDALETLLKNYSLYDRFQV